MKIESVIYTVKKHLRHGDLSVIPHLKILGGSVLNDGRVRYPITATVKIGGAKFCTTFGSVTTHYNCKIDPRIYIVDGIAGILQHSTEYVYDYAADETGLSRFVRHAALRAARFGYPTDRFSAAIEQFDYAVVMDAVESYLSGIR